MKKLLWVVCASFGVVMLSSNTIAQSSSDLALVRSALTSYELGVHESVIERHLPSLGDRTAVAIMKLGSISDLGDAKKIPAYLELIRLAFSYPDAISDQIDKQPGVTFVLLDYLSLRTKDPEILAKIADMKRSLAPRKQESH